MKRASLVDPGWLLLVLLGCGPAQVSGARRSDTGGADGEAPSGGHGGSSTGAADAAGGRLNAPDGAAPTGDVAVTAPDAPGPDPGQPVTLPLVVTDHFPDQGWFGDGSVMARFAAGSTIIRQVESTSGPCAARPPGARGKCLAITYTPPPGLVPGPNGGWVGVYFLRSLALSHPELSPPARAGDPNWGAEPGLALVPGATSISFYAAAPDPGLAVTFRAGTDRDTFVLPEARESLTTAWAHFALPLAGATYRDVIGAFAWVLKDTSKPATFYLDGILWEGAGANGITPPPVAPPGKRDGVRQVLFMNQCKETVWVGALGAGVPEGGGFRLDAGQSHTLTLPGGKWTGRFWGRTGCAFDPAGAGSCETGDCGARLQCGNAGGKPPATLAELTLSGGGADPDFYDLSLVDGYNLPMAMAPLEGTYTRSPGVAHDCLAPSCTSDLNQTCPADLQVAGAGGKVVACQSACERFKSDEFCCAGAHNTPATCPRFSYADAFKRACPTAYSYAYDDATSTFTCKGEDYAIWFCP
jgi:hypothetical protein